MKISRVGFAVVKLLVHGEVFFLMRRSKKWHDVSFIGGHENDRDAHKLLRAAYRELLEEVPTLRKSAQFDFAPLTDEFCYGPVHSQSANMLVGYELQFFLVKFLSTPSPVLELLGPRTPNLLLRQADLLSPGKFKIAMLVELLDGVLPGGLRSIDLSWHKDIALNFDEVSRTQPEQLFLRFRA